MNDFYDQLAPYYHLIYPDWEASIERQAEQLTNIIRNVWREQVRSILDVSCGIGTQAIGLARRGFAITASDLSEREIERACKEARARGLDIRFSVCDMRRAYEHHAAQFDLVISCDNSISHLLSDEEVLVALREIHNCVSPGGGCLLTIRDYEKQERGTGLIKPYGVREDGDKRHVVFQVWDFDGDQYDLSMYFVEENRSTGVTKTHLMRTRYYAISPTRLLQLMQTAGFESVQRIDNRFCQPVLVGTKNA